MHMFHSVREVVAPVERQAALFDRVCQVAAPGRSLQSPVVFGWIERSAVTRLVNWF